MEGGEDEAKWSQECHGKVGGGIWWAVSVSGVYHYEEHHWVWQFPAGRNCNKIWGASGEQPTNVACWENFNGEVPQGPKLKIHGPLSIGGDYRFAPATGHMGFSEVSCLHVWGELYPRAPLGEGAYRNPMHSTWKFINREKHCV